MAEDTPLPVQSGLLDPLIGAGFFTPNMSLEEIKRRRAIASALASRARGYPKTIGEGMTYFGEAIADRMQEQRLAEAEKGYNERYNKAAGMPVAGDTLPPVVPAPAVATPSPIPPAPVGPTAAVNPLTVEPATGPASREAIARAIALRNGAVPPRPTATAGSPPSTLPPAGSGPLVSRNASLDGGVTIADDEGNPPTVSRDIRPMVMAQARTGAPPAAPTQPPAAPGGMLAPIIPPDPGPMPPAPERSERMTPNEQHRANILRQFPGDERAIREFGQAHELGKAARDAEYERQKREHDVLVDIWKQKKAAREAAITSAPEKQLQLQKEGAAATAAQAGETARLTYGNLPEPVQKTLEASKEKAALSSSAIEAVNNAREAQKYAVSGTGADWQLQWYRLKAKTGDKEAQRVVQASETYKANLVPIMQTMLKSLAGKDISTKELEFIRSVSGADLSLDKTSADRMLAIAERVARQDVQSHRDTVETMIKGQPESAHQALRKIYDVREPLSGVPLTDASTGGYKEGDIARGKPGQPDLVRRGGKWMPM